MGWGGEVGGRGEKGGGEGKGKGQQMRVGEKGGERKRWLGGTAIQSNGTLMLTMLTKFSHLDMPSKDQ